jgi:hypothetical protein
VRYNDIGEALKIVHSKFDTNDTLDNKGTIFQNCKIDTGYLKITISFT